VIGAVIVLNIRETPVVVNITRRLDTISVASAQNGDLTSDRMHHWTRAIQIFSEFPSGSGLGTAGFAAHLSGVAEETVGEGTFFRILAEQGVPGILAFVYLVLSLFWILWRLLPVCGERLRPLGASLLAFHTGFVIHAMVASTYDYYFVVFIGLFVSGAHQHLAAQRRLALPRYVELARIP
jgi:O-antigen ligase